jgi:glycine hydroxymethyltransferase
MNPRAEALLSRGLSSRPSLGYPGAKHEAAIEALEEIELLAAALTSKVFGARFVEVRLPTGCMANLCVFMALTKPGEAIVSPPLQIGGHSSHHLNGAAGLYGLKVVEAPVDPDGYTIDIAALQALCNLVRPKLITVGGSLNLRPHPVAQIRAVADSVGAFVLYDAAHVAALIAGGEWQPPLETGAHIMTMSTYKSLAGPAGGLVLTNDPDLARRIERAAFPGLTANFDVARCAALAVALTDILRHGSAYAAAMIEAAQGLASALSNRGVDVFGDRRQGFTWSHQFGIRAERYGGGRAAVLRLRRANLLTSEIGLPPLAAPNGTDGIRLGTPELVRIGMRAADMDNLAELIFEALSGKSDPLNIGHRVSNLRASFTALSFVD